MASRPSRAAFIFLASGLSVEAENRASALAFLRVPMRYKTGAI
jgi:hypothetical protein